MNLIQSVVKLRAYITNSFFVKMTQSLKTIIKIINYLLGCQSLEKVAVMHLHSIAMLKNNNYTEVWYLLGQQLILVIGFDMYGKAVLI
jgi:hypothetical protein